MPDSKSEQDKADKAGESQKAHQQAADQLKGAEEAQKEGEATAAKADE